MGLIDEFRSTLASEDAKIWREMVVDQRYRDIKSNDDCYNTLTLAAPRNVETATKRLADITASLEALPLAEHIDRLLDTAPKGTDAPDIAAALGSGGAPTPHAPVNGQVESLHRQIDTLDKRLKALSALVQRLSAV